MWEAKKITIMFTGLALITLLISGCENPPSKAGGGNPFNTADASVQKQIDRMIQSMVRETIGTKPNVAPSRQVVMVVQFGRLENQAQLSNKKFGKLITDIQVSMADSGKKYSVIFASAREHRPVAAHRLDIAILPMPEEESETLLLRMGLTGPDHANNITTLWEDSAIIPMP